MSTRFYFNSENDHTDLDPEGIELADVGQAQQEALGLLGRMLQETDGDGLWRGKAWKVWVTDAPDGKGYVFFDLRVSASEPSKPV